MINYNNSRKIIVIIAIFLLSICLLTNTVNGVSIDKNTVGGIKKAINQSKNGDTIVLDKGKYTGTSNSGITINKKLTIRGKGPASSVLIDGGGKRRIFTIANNVEIIFINITFENGNAKERGGAIFNGYKNSKMTFINCTFNNDNAGIQGGAIYNSYGSCSIYKSIFKNNAAEHSAGAIYNGFNGKCYVSQSTFTNNIAVWGGTIFNGNEGYLTVSKSTFTKNTAIRAGIIYNNPNCKAVLENNIIKSNSGNAIENLGNLSSKFNTLSANTPSKFMVNGNVKSGVKNKTKTTLQIASFKPLYNKSNLIKASLSTQKGKILSGKQVNLFINGKLISKSKTNNNGLASFKYTFKTRKFHKVTVKFKGDKKFDTISKTMSTTPKDITYLNLNKFTVKQGKKVTFKATLKNNHKKGMKGNYISFYANYSYLGKAKTNSKGDASFSKIITTKGRLSFVAMYTGSKKYHESSFTRKLTVK